MKKVVFIGNREKVFQVLSSRTDIFLVKAYIVKKSLINIAEASKQTLVEVIDESRKKDDVFNSIEETSFDILVSAGCPFILPIMKFGKGRLFINCHPSFLPYGKGCHPLNECFLSDHKFSGVTIHHMDDGIDTGEIIQQVGFKITDDLDVSLLYGFVFDLEAELLNEVISEMIGIETSSTRDAYKVSSTGTYYTRPNDTISLKSEDLTCSNLLQYSRAFSTQKLGVTISLEEKMIKVYNVKEITNDFLVARYYLIPFPKIVFMNEDVILLKLVDGLMAINKFEVLSAN